MSARKIAFDAYRETYPYVEEALEMLRTASDSFEYYDEDTAEEALGRLHKELFGGSDYASQSNSLLNKVEKLIKVETNGLRAAFISTVEDFERDIDTLRDENNELNEELEQTKYELSEKVDEIQELKDYIAKLEKELEGALSYAE